MFDKISVLFQHLLPQHLLSYCMGKIADCRWLRWKNFMIQHFIKRYSVDMSLAQLENPTDYPTFNSFFTRHLKPALRPVTQNSNEIASPVDGSVSQLGKINGEQLFQAKGFYFSLSSLLGNSPHLSKLFHNGNFVTLYLAPKDYHRVHMPLSGKLQETIYIPGRLFSVNQKTTHTIPCLFSRNERLVCLFETEMGPMIIILIGAMLVGSLNTAWGTVPRTKTIVTNTFSDGIELARGADMGHFKMGSTVILLFPENTMQWANFLAEDTVVKMGEPIGMKKG